MSDIYATAMHGVSIHDLDTAIAPTKLHMKWREGFFELYDSLKSNDFKIFVISASPAILIRKALQDMKVDGIFGLEIETRGNIFTGRHFGAMTSNTKASIISDHILKYKAHSFGVTDSTNDIVAFSGISTIYLLGNHQLDSRSSNVIPVSSLSDVKRKVAQMNLPA